MDMADRLGSFFLSPREELYEVADGYRDAGYVGLHIDDYWMSYGRDAEGYLQANQSRFPSGIPALADYIHELGLKFGIYEDYGTKTCEDYPGSYSYLQARISSRLVTNTQKDADFFAR